MPAGQAIRLTFSRFQLEEGGAGCGYDSLTVLDGHTVRAPVLGRYCGHGTISWAVLHSVPQSAELPGGAEGLLTTHNAALLQFRSDHSVADEGFSLTWNATSPQCGGLVCKIAGYSVRLSVTRR